MEKIFLNILNMSIVASYVIIFVLIFRLLLKKAPKAFSYLLWPIVFLRLIVPFSFESNFSILAINNRPIPKEIGLADIPQINSGIDGFDRAVNGMLPLANNVGSINPMQSIIKVSMFIWLLGISIFLIHTLISTLKFTKNLKEAKLVEENIYIVDKIESAFVFGFFKPSIYIPKGLSGEERKYIVCHEKIHIKRFDHIFKILAFSILILHWFNPLVWLSFYLMVEDMELSCDERVIRELGYDVKESYSKTLLSLSSGQRVSGISPLAFGENNTKTRIKNILNYKKPSFWLIAIIIGLLIFLTFGLLSDKPEKNLDITSMSVEEYAINYLEEISNTYGQNTKILDKKISSLEKIYVYEDGDLESDLEVWKLEYRIRPEDIDKIKVAGDMEVVDGYITENSGAAKQYIINYRGEDLQFMDILSPLEYQNYNIPIRELSLRKYLEDQEYVPAEIYKGDHIIAEFPLSTGETSKLFLSQPVKKGEDGLWIVERFMDGNGTIYLQVPDTELEIDSYYEGLQKELDDGNTELKNIEKIVFDHIFIDLGQTNIKRREIKILENQKLADFLALPKSHYMGYVSNLQVDEEFFYFDRVEYLTLEDEERLEELQVDTDRDMDNGYYIYNPYEGQDYFSINKDIDYYIQKNNKKEKVSLDEFKEYLDMNDVKGYRPLFNIYTEGEDIYKIEEQYIP